MSTTADELVSEIRALPHADKMRVLEAILAELHVTDPEIESVWAEEAKKRWAAYKEGRIGTVSYEDVMAKHRE
jgi:putative addiction module component (TIGR02574 family)